MSPEQIKEAEALKEEFYLEATTEERRIEIATWIQERAIEDPNYNNKCGMGYGEVVFHIKYDHALIPGHIYSSDGIREYNISRLCEYHFDELGKEPEEDA